MANRSGNDNRQLNSAKSAKNDEFYTQLLDIENELRHYKEQLRGKVIFCNCDDPYESNFFKYFALQFNSLELKKLIATCYTGSPIADTQLSLFDHEPPESKTTRSPHKIMMTELTDYNGDTAEDLTDIRFLLAHHKNALTKLKGDGDFRSEECIELLKEADIVVTNPPFSLFREFVAQLMEYDKKFIIVGNKNAITYKEIFPLIKENKLWIGYQSMGTDMLFDIPKEAVSNFVANSKEGSGYRIVDGVVKARASAVWFTNLDVKKRYEELTLYKRYTSQEYPKYDNCDAIEVAKVVEIPKDYDGVMGVPISFLDKYNPNQFEILGSADDKDYYLKIFGKYKGRITINGKQPFKRIFIRRKS